MTAMLTRFRMVLYAKDWASELAELKRGHRGRGGASAAGGGGEAQLRTSIEVVNCVLSWAMLTHHTYGRLWKERVEGFFES